MTGSSATGTSWSFPIRLPGSWEDDKAHPTSDRADFPHVKAAKTSEAAQGQGSSRCYGPRQCRICLDVVEPTFHDDDDFPLHPSMGSGPRVTYNSEDGGRLLSPCKCKGSQKYVHEECLNSWRKAAPETRNCWECPTCSYKYRLQRLTWGHLISSTVSQIVLTLAICVLAIFLLGFVADPIINLYNFDPVVSIVASKSTDSYQLWEDDGPVTWTEHFMKGLAGLSLLGFIKFLVTLTPLQLFNVRSGDAIMGRSSLGQAGRNRSHQITWMVLIVGIATVLWAIWKAVRAWSRITLQRAGERVMDVPGSNDNDGDDGDDGDDDPVHQ